MSERWSCGPGFWPRLPNRFPRAEHMAAEQHLLPYAAHAAHGRRTGRRGVPPVRKACGRRWPWCPRDRWPWPPATPPAPRAASVRCRGRHRARRCTTPWSRAPRRIVSVEPYFLDRYPVTNRLYYEFVHAGGYREKNWWDDGIWTAVPNMVDSTGLAGPRFWSDGRYAPGEGIARGGRELVRTAACARWFGNVCPAMPNGSRPVPPQCRCRPTCFRNAAILGAMPWTAAANLWGSGPNRHAPVRVSRRRQRGRHLPLDRQRLGMDQRQPRRRRAGAAASPLTGPRRSIRGGAFERIFDNKPPASFKVGESFATPS